MRQVDILRVWHLGDNIVFKEKKKFMESEDIRLQTPGIKSVGGKKKKKGQSLITQL